MKKPLLLLMILFLLACSKKQPLDNDHSKALYTMGQMYARRIESLNLSEKDAEVLIQGIKDWAVHKKSEVDYEAQLPNVQKLIDQKVGEQAKVEKAKGQEYMEKFLKDGGKKTASGLAYKIINPGSAKKPKATDWVEVHYHGTFIDGKTFDSSMDRKQKAKFPLNGVIKGWTEGVQMIGEGGEIDLVIPSDLAYGDRGAPPTIPGGATLVFKVQLFKVLGNKPPES